MRRSALVGPVEQRPAIGPAAFQARQIAAIAHLPAVVEPAVVDTRDGGFAIRVQYDRHGTLVLDSVTTQYRGRRIAIFSQYGSGKLERSRWLAAPYGSPITDGVLLFTPSATREESEEIVLGLNNIAKKVAKGGQF